MRLYEQVETARFLLLNFPKHSSLGILMKKLLLHIYYSFPFQLLMLHLRSNVLLLGIWILLSLFLTGALAEGFGLRYLFVSPEYMGEVGFWSFFYLGMSFGALVMSWNLTTYLLGSHHFPFLASLSRPFTKFCLNNLIIPMGFALLFLGCSIHFGWHDDYLSRSAILINALSFLLGIGTLVACIAGYFMVTNKDILSYVNPHTKVPPNLQNAGPGRRYFPDLEAVKLNKDQWRVDTYLTESFRLRIVRSVAHYDARTLLRVFKQNHTNALIVQLFSLVVLVVLGYLIDRPSFRIPAGASIFLLSNIVVAVTGAISYWFHRWRMFVLLMLFIGVNQITRYDFLHHKNKAYGLDYQSPPASYSYENLEEVCSSENVEQDKANTLAILENWKQKNAPKSGKPKMALYCVSGGGLKATVWSMNVLQHADSLTKGALTDQTVLMSGASGGMIGTAYFRELLLQKTVGNDLGIHNPKHIDYISKDLLNSIAFTIVTNDLFIPWTSFEKGGFQYKRDRGYIFEQQLNENTDFLLDKKMSDYTVAEQNADIPLIFITPSIVNDGRRMIISSQGVSYMMAAPIGLQISTAVEIDAIDFGRLFSEQNAAEMQFTTALRMNATYPYILPNVHLPSKPVIELLDAGFRDNFGLKSAIRFIHVFQDWIKENTSGVVLIIVRAYDRDKTIKSSEQEGIFETMLDPLGIAGKILTLQDYEHDTNLGFIYALLGQENFEIIRFTYRPSEKQKNTSISFHITKREKQDILEAIGSEENQESLRRLKEVLNDSLVFKY